MSAIGTAAMGEPGVSAMLGRLTFALLWLVAAVDALYLVALIATAGDYNLLVSVWLSLATQWVPVTVFWLVCGRSGFRQPPMILVAAAVTFSALGDTYYSLAMDADGFLASPSPADAGYLLFYPLMATAVILLVRRDLRGVGGLALLETAVATVGVSAVLAVLLDPSIADALAGDDVGHSLIALAYPVFDLILLALLAGTASLGTHRTMPRRWALYAGLGIFAVGDIAYAVLERQGAYMAGSPLDATWAVGLGLIAWWSAGGHARASTDRPPTSRSASLIPIPAVAVVAGLAVLVIGTQVPVSVLAVVLAAATVGLAAAPIIFRQAMLGRMLAARDEAVKRLTELDQAKTDILVTMNHEFRTPLTTINGHVELLLEGQAGELPPTAVQTLRVIERSGARLQGLIEETLTASMLESGQDRLVRAPVVVAGIVSSAAAAVEARAASRRVVIVTEVSDIALIVDADGAQLERALVSLLDNAVKFSAPGGEVVISLTGSTADRELVIRVRDDGIGIPPGDMPQLFTRFFRASNVRNAAVPGVGLGLSITQQIVEAHGGTIAIDSTLGVGTTVTVRLPTSSRVGRLGAA